VDVAVVLSERVRDALARAFGEEHRGADPAVHRSSFADYQADAALRLAKPLKKPPLELAKAIAAALDVKDLVAGEAGVSVSPPGFVNFTLGRTWLERALAGAAVDPRAGVPETSRPETVVVDYSGPNVAKEMHVGHIRSTVIGDAVARILGFVGHQVIRQNHVGDWGTPFGMLIEHLTDVGAEPGVGGHLGDRHGQPVVRERDVEEPRSADLDRLRDPVEVEVGQDLRGHLPRRHPDLLGEGQGSVDLEVRELGGPEHGVGVTQLRVLGAERRGDGRGHAGSEDLGRGRHSHKAMGRYPFGGLRVSPVAGTLSA